MLGQARCLQIFPSGTVPEGLLSYMYSVAPACRPDLLVRPAGELSIGRIFLFLAIISCPTSLVWVMLSPTHFSSGCGGLLYRASTQRSKSRSITLVFLRHVLPVYIYVTLRTVLTLRASTACFSAITRTLGV
ncbi:hypothetical protein K470DRAFT_91987 [Piedraia hortae CBS 480.64]|uniref:Uncharacterized protein n=1 Tax=Piedraia hortae CBS 480.64 TaxID=1314780 RepID=A0A6A7BXN2_9PEZI|nr:hypothetical protein K470DRAFT_91987 [Piedraia hortae CBS 480.64]